MNPKKFEGNLSMNIYGFPFKKDEINLFDN